MAFDHRNSGEDYRGTEGHCGIVGEDLILEVSHPELYRVNAFCVLSLRVDASTREIARASERLRLSQRLGGDWNARVAPLPFAPSPDSDAVRNATQRLQDPERRLVDELFWFWPTEPGNRSDEALAALTRGEMQRATNLWIDCEVAGTDDGTAAHNLAVLAHVEALELEAAAKSAPLTEDQSRRRSICWQEGLGRWRRLVEQESFWNRLADRARALDDPRLTSTTAQGLRTALPLALLSINAKLALRAAERGDVGEAQSHLTLIRRAGFDETVGDAAVAKVATPVRDRMRALCQAAELEANADGARADRTARRLLEQADRLLGVVDCLLSRDGSIRVSVHDEVALTVLASGLTFGNTTKQWDTALDLLQEARSRAVSESVRARIDENAAIYRKNIEATVCWFCSRAAAEDSAARGIKMYGDVRTELAAVGVGVGMRTTWRSVTVKVPRCRRCRRYHVWGVPMGALGLLSGAAISGALAAGGAAWADLFFQGPVPDSVVAVSAVAFVPLMIVCGLLVNKVTQQLLSERGSALAAVGSQLAVVGAVLVLLGIDLAGVWKTTAVASVLILAAAVLAIARRKARALGRDAVQIRAASASHEYPEIKRFLAEGWNFGARPPAA